LKSKQALSIFQTCPRRNYLANKKRSQAFNHRGHRGHGESRRKNRSPLGQLWLFGQTSSVAFVSSVVKSSPGTWPQFSAVFHNKSENRTASAQSRLALLLRANLAWGKVPAMQT